MSLERHFTTSMTLSRKTEGKREHIFLRAVAVPG